MKSHMKYIPLKFNITQGLFARTVKISIMFIREKHDFKFKVILSLRKSNG